MKVVKITDIEQLVKLRFDYFRHDPLMPAFDAERLVSALRGYFEKHLAEGDFVALAVMKGGEVAAVGFLAASEMPPSGSVPGGRIGTLFNVLTYPEHRGSGYGKILIQALIDEARALGLSIIELHATEQGSWLYSKMGFRPIDYKAMRLKLSK